MSQDSLHTACATSAASQLQSDTANHNLEASKDSPASSQCTLFLGDLPKFCSESQLLQLLAPFGEVESLYMKKNKRDGTSLGYGFATLASHEQAARAMRELNGAMFGGRSLRVRWGIRKEDLPPSSSASSTSSSSSPSSPSAAHTGGEAATAKDKAKVEAINSLYICFSVEAPHIRVTEETLHKVFSQFGHLEDVTIKASEVDKESLCQSGYGFVQFHSSLEGIQAAYDNIRALHLETVDGVQYQCEPSNNLLKLLKLRNIIDQDIKPQAKVSRAARKSILCLSKTSASAAEVASPLPTQLPESSPPSFKLPAAFASQQQQGESVGWLQQSGLLYDRSIQLREQPRANFPKRSRRHSGQPQLQIEPHSLVAYGHGILEQLAFSPGGDQLLPNESSLLELEEVNAYYTRILDL